MRFRRLLLLGLTCALGFIILPTTAYTFGSRSKEPKVDTRGIQAHPIRRVDFAHLTVPAFYLPNGSRVDMNTDLATIVDTEINGSRYFRTTNDTDARLVISGGVTSLELDVLQLNLRIGWNPGGSLPIVGDPGVSGEVDLKLSNLSMDFKVYDRVTGVTYLASYTDETLSDLRFSVRVEISQIGSSIELLTKTRLAAAVRSAVTDIMENMEDHPDMPFVPWETVVVGISEGSSKLTMAAGGREGIKKNYVFSVYSKCDPNNPDFCFERFLADIKVNQVGVNSSTAEAYSGSDSLVGIFPGDKVYVKPMRD